MVTADRLIERHRKRFDEFLSTESEFRPEEMRRMALAAIHAGGEDGVTMAAVHQSVKSRRPKVVVLRMTVKRLIDDGLVHMATIKTAGRPRTQLWSFPHILSDLDAYDLAVDMAGRGHETGGRPSWLDKTQEYLIREVLGSAGGEELSAKDIELLSGQLYVDANTAMLKLIFRGKRGLFMNNKAMTAFLTAMVRDRVIEAGADGFRSNWKAYLGAQ
jgi:hypothetical protein